MIMLYADYLLIAIRDRSKVEQVKTAFKARFKMKDLGEAKEFLTI